MALSVHPPRERVSNRLRQNPNDSSLGRFSPPGRMNIHRYTAFPIYDLLSLPIPSVRRLPLVTLCVPKAWFQAFIANREGEVHSGGEFHRWLVSACASCVRSAEKTAKGRERERNTHIHTELEREKDKGRVIERKRKRDEHERKGEGGHHVLYRVRQSFSSTRTRREALCATVQRNYTVSYRCEKLDAFRPVCTVFFSFFFYRRKSQLCLTVNKNSSNSRCSPIIFDTWSTLACFWF